jgi:hypothetical protein
MTGQLPPSKFGKGYTYGGTDQSAPSPHFAPPPASPGAQPYPAASGGSGYQAPPPLQSPYAPPSAPNPFDVTPPDPYAAAPLVNPYGGGQAITPAWQPGPLQSGQPTGWSVGTFLGSGEGAPKTAAILSIVGGLWAALTVVQRFDQIKLLFKFYKYAKHLPSGSGWYYLTMAATIAEIVAVPLLLLAGFLLWQRNPGSLKLVMAGNGIVVAVNLLLAVAVNNAANALTGAVTGVMNKVDDIATQFGFNTSRIDSFADKYAGALNDKISSLSSEFIIFHLVLPALLAVVALVLARSVATKLWVQPTAGYLP